MCKGPVARGGKAEYREQKMASDAWCEMSLGKQRPSCAGCAKEVLSFTLRKMGIHAQVEGIRFA
jgi:hypothetical protein